MSASANPSDSARLSSTSLRKTNGKTAMDVSSFGLARLAVDDPWAPAGVARASSTASADGIPLRGVLAQQRLHNAGEVRAYVRRHVNRRWIVVEDRVQRINR